MVISSRSVIIALKRNPDGCFHDRSQYIYAPDGLTLKGTVQLFSKIRRQAKILIQKRFVFKAINFAHIFINFVIAENRQGTNATLGHTVWISGGNCTGKASHGQSVENKTLYVKKYK